MAAKDLQRESRGHYAHVRLGNEAPGQAGHESELH